jgi:hypothetical protein
MQVYPDFINDALGTFVNAYGKPKKKMYQEILRALTARRPLFKAAGDIVSFGRSVLGW